MNKAAIVAAVAAAALFFGCKKSNNKPSSVSASIVGKWTFSRDTISDYVNSQLQHTQVETTDDTKETVQFNSDGTGTTIEDGTSLAFTYKLSGNTLTVNTPAYTSNGVNVAAAANVETIQKLTANLLVMSNSETAATGGVNYKENTVTYFTR